MSIRKRGKTWTVTIDVGRTPDGKRKQQTKGGFKTKREATQWETEQLGRLQRGEFIEPSKITFGAYLDQWLAGHRVTLKPSTFESYERTVRRHIKPRLGHVPLQQLSGEHLSAEYRAMLDGGRLPDGGKLAAGSVRYVHAIIARALADAVTTGKVVRNVASTAKLPSGRAREMRTWTAEQVARFLTTLEKAGDPLYAPVALAVTTGMRRGEVLGLRWSDVDLDAGRLSVRQSLTAPRDVDTNECKPTFSEPKTDRGRRVVPIPAQTVTILRKHRREQIEERLMSGLGQLPADALVFIDGPDGRPIHPDIFRRRFERRVGRSGLPYLRFHDLRHTYATLQLRAGTHPKIVSGILGHAKVALTLDIYSHAVPELGEQSAEMIGAMVFGEQMVSIGRS